MPSFKTFTNSRKHQSIFRKKRPLWQSLVSTHPPQRVSWVMPGDEREDWSIAPYTVAGDAYAKNFGSNTSTGAGACGVKKWKKHEPGLWLVLMSEKLACRSQLGFVYFICRAREWCLHTIRYYANFQPSQPGNNSRGLEMIARGPEAIIVKPNMLLGSVVGQFHASRRPSCSICCLLQPPDRASRCISLPWCKEIRGGSPCLAPPVFQPIDVDLKRFQALLLYWVCSLGCGWCWFVMKEQYCWLAGSWC